MVLFTYSKPPGRFLSGLSHDNMYKRLGVGIVFLLLSACAGNGNSHVSPDELLASIKSGTAPTIVDVRTQGEYDSGHVPGAIHLPFYSVWTRNDAIMASPKDRVVVYCEHGPRAGLAKFGLWTVGFKNIVYLEGHMSGWKELKLPIEKMKLVE